MALHGRDCCLTYSTHDMSHKPSQAFRSLFLHEIIQRGVLAASLTTSYAHTPADIDKTVDAIDAALQIYARALNDGVEKYLVGRPSQVVQRRFNTVMAAE